MEMREDMYRIGIDIGGMSAKFGLVEEDRVLEERVLETGGGISYGDFLDAASACISELRKNREGALHRIPPRQELRISHRLLP